MPKHPCRSCSLTFERSLPQAIRKKFHAASTSESYAEISDPRTKQGHTRLDYPNASISPKLECEELSDGLGPPITDENYVEMYLNRTIMILSSSTLLKVHRKKAAMALRVKISNLVGENY